MYIQKDFHQRKASGFVWYPIENMTYSRVVCDGLKFALLMAKFTFTFKVKSKKKQTVVVYMEVSQIKKS